MKQTHLINLFSHHFQFSPPLKKKNSYNFCTIQFTINLIKFTDYYMFWYWSISTFLHKIDQIRARFRTKEELHQYESYVYVVK